jgi:hypothetical protein
VQRGLVQAVGEHLKQMMCAQQGKVAVLHSYRMLQQKYHDLCGMCWLHSVYIVRHSRQQVGCSKSQLIMALGPHLEHVSYIAHKRAWQWWRIHPLAC